MKKCDICGHENEDEVMYCGRCRSGKFTVIKGNKNVHKKNTVDKEEDNNEDMFGFDDWEDEDSVIIGDEIKSEKVEKKKRGTEKERSVNSREERTNNNYEEDDNKKSLEELIETVTTADRVWRWIKASLAVYGIVNYIMKMKKFKEGIYIDGKSRDPLIYGTMKGAWKALTIWSLISSVISAVYIVFQIFITMLLSLLF